MKNKFLCSKSIIYFIAIFEILPILIICVVLTTTKQLNILYLLLIPFLFSAFLIPYRKVFFSKIEVKSDGIYKTYGNNIINKISWDKLYSIKAVPKYNLLFIEKEMSRQELLNSYKTNICFHVNKTNIAILLNFKDKFKGKIGDISLLSKYHQELLLVN